MSLIKSAGKYLVLSNVQECMICRNISKYKVFFYVYDIKSSGKHPNAESITPEHFQDFIAKHAMSKFNREPDLRNLILFLVKRSTPKYIGSNTRTPKYESQNSYKPLKQKMFRYGI